MANEHIVSHRQDSPGAPIYRAMRARVLQWLAKNGKRSVAITSVGEGEGRTLTAINLALAISMDVNQTALWSTRTCATQVCTRASASSRRMAWTII